jgi:hypothetical protein
MLKQKFAIFILLFNCSLFANIGNFELQAKKNIKIASNKHHSQKKKYS